MGCFQDPSGDGKIDLSDPVYLLTFLFLGGPPPFAACEPLDDCRIVLEDFLYGLEALSRLPTTGQRSCFDAANAPDPTCALAGEEKLVLTLNNQ